MNLHAVQVSISRDMAILSLVGKHMKNMVGTAGKMFSCVLSFFSFVLPPSPASPSQAVDLGRRLGESAGR